MPTMITRNAAKGAARKSVKPALKPWTDPALVEQMTIVESILLRAPVNLKNLSNQCLLLSKVLDFLVATNRKPSQRHDLLPLVGQVCKYKDKRDVRPALLILLLSVKSAFRAEWLSTLEVSKNGEIFATLNTLFDSFTTGDNISAESSMQPLQCGGSAVNNAQEALQYLASITKRFYPRLLFNAAFVTLQAKVGYEILVCDFHVPHMHIQDRVFLYVGKRDSIETAACLITPSQVSFLVNGHQVEKRVNSGYVDGSPQMPSDVTGLVKVGANVLQVIGEFSEAHVIAVTSARALECSAKTTQLEDYVAPTIAASCEVNSKEGDDEVVEGASRVSLRCPISHQRLVAPVKGATCRHLQCFDFDSFLEINEKRPAWRCPCCNRFTSCPDLRIDRHMERILQEADEKVQEVMIFQDGSWVPGENQINSGPDATGCESGEIAGAVIDLCDIGDEEVNGDRVGIDEFFQHQDRKPDKETLKAPIEIRGIPPQASKLASVSVAETTASAPRSVSEHAGSLRGGSRLSHDNEPATNHNIIQAPHSQPGPNPPLTSPAGDVSGSAPIGGHTTSTPQQPHTPAPSNTGVGSRRESVRIRQRLDRQQRLDKQQRLERQQRLDRQQLLDRQQRLDKQQQLERQQRLDRQQLLDRQQPPRTQTQVTRPQWKGSDSVQQQQLRTAIARHAHLNNISTSPRPMPTHQLPPRPWDGAARHLAPAAQQMLYENAAALQQNWQPAHRLRGSLTNPYMLRPAPCVQPWLPAMDPVLGMQFQMGMPAWRNPYAMPFPRGPG